MNDYRERIKKLFNGLFSKENHAECLELIIGRETWYYAGKSSMSGKVASFLNKIKEKNIIIKDEDDFHERLIKILDITQCSDCERYDVIRFIEIDEPMHICKKGENL